MSDSEPRKNSSSKVKSWLANVALLAATAILLFAACEIAIRMIDSPHKDGEG